MQDVNQTLSHTSISKAKANPLNLLKMSSYHMPKYPPTDQTSHNKSVEPAIINISTSHAKAPVTFCNMLIKLFLITHIPSAYFPLNHKPQQHNSSSPKPHSTSLPTKKSHIEQCWGSLTTSLSLSPVKTLFISLPVFFTSCNLQFLVTGHSGLTFGCNPNRACVFS